MQIQHQQKMLTFQSHHHIKQKVLLILPMFSFKRQKGTDRDIIYVYIAPALGLTVFIYEGHPSCPVLLEISSDIFLIDKYALGDESNIIELSLPTGSLEDLSFLSSSFAFGYFNGFLYQNPTQVCSYKNYKLKRQFSYQVGQFCQLPSVGKFTVPIYILSC